MFPGENEHELLSGMHRKGRAEGHAAESTEGQSNGAPETDPTNRYYLKWNNYTFREDWQRPHWCYTVWKGAALKCKILSCRAPMLKHPREKKEQIILLTRNALCRRNRKRDST